MGGFALEHDNSMKKSQLNLSVLADSIFHSLRQPDLRQNDVGG